MTDTVDNTDATQNVTGGTVTPAKRKLRALDIVFALAFLGIPIWMFARVFSLYASMVRYDVTTTTYTSTVPGLGMVLFPYGLLAAAGLFAVVLNLYAPTGRLNLQLLFLATCMAAMIAFMVSIMGTAILQNQALGDKPTLQSWLQTNYHVQNYDLPRANGTFVVLDTANNKQTFTYTLNGNTEIVKHVSSER